MSASPTEPHVTPEPQDPVEALSAVIPIVLPLIGGALIFLLAFIAVYMA
jgi:hypothetical protein